MTKLVTKKQVREDYGVPYSFTHLARLEALGLFPSRIKLGSRLDQIQKARIAASATAERKFLASLS